jgi:lactoylglutathione lyase
MKTLLIAYRVADLDRSLDFYTTLGYTKVGTVTLDGGDRLAILKFPDEPAATLELVHRPGGGRVDVGSGFDHLAIQVDTLAATLDRLTEAGLEPGPVKDPAGLLGPRPPNSSSRFTFCPEAVTRASQFARSSVLSLIFSMPCHCLASPNSGSIHTCLLRMASLQASVSW